MTGISDADMDRIEQFVERNKFERSPEQLCPDDEDEEEDDADGAGRPQAPAAAEG